MNKFVWAIAFFCAPLLAQTTETLQSSISTPPAERVAVLFSATDARGNPILDLAKEQVSVSDNNQPVEVIELSKATDLPLHLAIVLLASKSSFSQQQAAAIDLLQKIFRPNVDKAFVVTAGGDRPWPSSRLEWMSDREALVRSIQGLDKSAGVPDPFRFDIASFETGGSRIAIQEYSDVSGGVFDVIWAMIKTDPRPARRVLFIFREPWGHSPGFSQRGRDLVEKRLVWVITTAQQLGVSLYVIGVEDPSLVPRSSTEIGRIYAPIHPGEGAGLRTYDEQMLRAREHAYIAGRANIERIAEQTGGRVWWSTKKNYSDAVLGIINELNGHYALTFLPATTSAATPAHALRVSVGRQGARLSVPKAFFVAVH